MSIVSLYNTSLTRTIPISSLVKEVNPVAHLATPLASFTADVWSLYEYVSVIIALRLNNGNKTGALTAILDSVLSTWSSCPV